MKKLTPLSKTEAVVGWLYLFIHTFALAYLVQLGAVYLLPLLDISLSTATLNVVYYSISFVFLLCFLFNFMKNSFGHFTANFLHTAKTVLWCYVVNVAASFAVQLVLGLVLEELTNPNSAAVNDQLKLNPNSMIVVGVILAPIVEEILFRGVCFGTIRKKSRIMAYVISALLFSVYHLWQYMLGGFSWQLVLYLAQYIPPSIVLAWCYEKCGNIWGPVFLHMMINYVSVRVTLGT